MSEEIWKKVECLSSHYAISEAELRFILDHAMLLPAHPVMLELGVCNGRTLVALGMVADLLDGMAYGIDHFRLEGSAEDVRNRLRDFKVERARVIECNTHDYPWTLPLDLLVVDAGHDEANVKLDIEQYVPFVKMGGYVFFDDYDEPYDPNSPHWAVRYFADMACAGWKDLGHVDGMKGWQRP